MSLAKHILSQNVRQVRVCKRHLLPARDREARTRQTMQFMAGVPIGECLRRVMNYTHVCSPLDSVTQSLEIRHVSTKFEIDQMRAALNDEHYLKAGRPAGNTVWQGIYQTDGDERYPVLCAALCWSGAALRLKDRDDWIGWDPLTRGSRLPLVTQLRRFVVLESRREPNLATRCMGLALRKLPGHFEEKYGYRPLLAESFSDPQLHEGTLYKASNWTALGFSKGFKRHKSEF